MKPEHKILCEKFPDCLKRFWSVFCHMLKRCPHFGPIYAATATYALLTILTKMEQELATWKARAEKREASLAAIHKKSINLKRENATFNSIFN